MSIKKFINPDAFDNSTGFVFHEGTIGCCGDTAPATCAYTITAASITAVTSMVIKENGVNRTLSVTTASNSHKDIRKGLATALQAAGYDPYYRMDAWMGIDILNGTLTFISNVEIVSVTVNSVVVNAVTSCTQGLVCQYVLDYPVDTDGGTLAGTELGDEEVFATGESAAITTAINTAMTNASIGQWRPLRITEADGNYRVVLYLENTHQLLRNDLTVVPRDCFTHFI